MPHLRASKPDDAKQDSKRRPERAKPTYIFTDRLPDGVTPEQAHERVIAVLGSVIKGAAR